MLRCGKALDYESPSGWEWCAPDACGGPNERTLNGEKVLTVLEEHGTAGCPGCAECGGK